MMDVMVKNHDKYMSEIAVEDDQELVHHAINLLYSATSNRCKGKILRYKLFIPTTLTHTYFMHYAYNILMFDNL